VAEYDDEGAEEQPPEQVNVRFYVPPEQEAGVYAETVAVWHTPYDFVIDFAAIQLAQPADPEDPGSQLEVPARVVSRVRIPAGLVFDVIQTINARMDAYEAEWGKIRAPELREQSEEQ
jgi:Protein of unknown function (DUF3467)